MIDNCCLCRTYSKRTHHQAYYSQEKIHQHKTCLEKTNESEPSIQESLELAQSYVRIYISFELKQETINMVLIM